MKRVLSLLKPLTLMMIAGGLSAHSAHAWTLKFSEGNFTYGSGCPARLEVQNPDSETLRLQAETSTGYTYAFVEFSDINQGRTCTRQNSSHIFGGMRCIESRNDGDQWTTGDCSTEFLASKCKPFGSHSAITTATITSTELQVRITNTAYYDGKPYDGTCTYEP